MTYPSENKNRYQEEGFGKGDNVMAVTRRLKKQVCVDTSDGWEVMSEKIKDNMCLPVAIGAVYKASPERCKLENGGEAAHYAIFRDEQHSIILDSENEITELNIMTDEVLRDISMAFGKGEEIVRETALRQIVGFCEALVENMGLPLKHNRVTVDLQVDFGVAIKKNKIEPILAVNDGIQLALSFRILTVGMDKHMEKEELKRLQERGIAAFCRMAVTFLQFRTNSDAEIEMVAVGQGIYLFNLKMNLSRRFLDYAYHHKNAMKELINFTSDVSSVSVEKAPAPGEYEDEYEEDIDTTVSRWFRQLRTVNYFAIENRAHIEKKITIQADNDNLVLHGLWVKERSKRVPFSTEKARHLDYSVWS